MLRVTAIDSNCSEKTITARGGKWIDDNSSTLALVTLPPKSAVRYKNRIKTAIINHNIHKHEPHLRIGLSIGFSLSETEEDTLEVLIQKADKLMFADKKRNA